MNDPRQPVITVEEALDTADRVISDAIGDRFKLREQIAKALLDAAFDGAERARQWGRDAALAAITEARL